VAKTNRRTAPDQNTKSGTPVDMLVKPNKLRFIRSLSTEQKIGIERGSAITPQFQRRETSKSHALI
jgi:hypothetical protein